MADDKNKANKEETGGEGIPTASYGGSMVGPGEKIGPYKLLRVLGEGGYGIVYLAERQRPVKRRVALKVIKPGMDTKQVIARFEAERQALALLDHPNIAHVFNAGTTKTGRPYFAMEYVKGVPITEHCDRYKLTIEERLKLFLYVCEAVQHAHQKAIIHRDIKPSNILVAFEGEQAVPMIIDFGVAKALTQSLTERTLVTEQAQMIGTPEYMSPEQAEMTSQDIDTRTDIYSLGVVLYELLTGTLPFDPKTLREGGPERMRQMIREQDPQTPSARLSSVKRDESLSLALHRRTDIRTLGHRLHGELDWITLKAMDKDRTRRYQTAHAFAEDIQRYLNQEPVLAGPPSTTYKVRKFVLRNKSFVISVVIITVILILATFFSIAQMLRANRAAEREQIAAVKAIEEKGRALQAETAAEKARSEEAQQRQRAESQKLMSRQRAYAAEMNVAFQALEENNLSRALELLDRQRPARGEEDLRGFEWRYLWKCCQSNNVASFNDRSRRGAAFSRDGRFLALAGDGVVVRDIASQAVIAEFPGSATTVAFSPTDDFMVTAGDTVNIINIKSWQVIQSLPESRYPAVFSPDGRWLVTRSEDGYRVWNVETWEKKGFVSIEVLLAWHKRYGLAFSPNGNMLLTPGQKEDGPTHGFQVWEFPSLKPLTHFVPSPEIVYTAVFLHDGKHLLTGDNYGNIHVWDIAKGRIIETHKEHTAWIIPLVVAPDGKTFVTGSSDSSIVIWDAATRQPLTRLRGHLGEIWALAISPDGRLLASNSNDGTMKLWDTSTRHTPLEFKKSSLCLGFSGDNRSLIAANRKGAIIWDLATRETTEISIPGAERLELLSHLPFASHGGRMLWLMGLTDGAVELWDLLNGNRVTAWPAFDSEVTTVAFSINDNLVAAGTENGFVKIWDVNTKREVSKFRVANNVLRCLAFSPNSRFLAISWGRGRIWIWDLVSMRFSVRLHSSKSIIPTVAFSPDGQLLASTTVQEHVVHLWEIPSGKLHAVLKGHTASVFGVAFTPDGKTLATADDHQVKLWNLATKQEVAAFSFGEPIWSMKFSSDGGTLAIGYGDLEMALKKKIRLFQVPSFEEIADTEAKEKSKIMLTRVEELRRASKNKSNPVELASITMSLYQFGHTKEAKVVLEKLHRVFENGKNSEFLKLLCGVEKLFADENSSLRQAWECIELGKLDDACQLIQKVQPLSLQQYNNISDSIHRITTTLAMAYYERGRSVDSSVGGFDETISNYESAISVDPNYALAFSDLAWLQAACPDTDFHNKSKAIENATKACELTEWKDQRYVGTLAAVYAKVGDFDKAVKWQKEATNLLTDDNRAQWQTIYESRLKLYQLRKPYDQGNLWSFSSGGMIGWWKFDKDHGDIAFDWSGYGNHGELEGDPQWINGIKGDALDLDGSDFITIDGIVDDITSNNITVSAWVKTTTLEEGNLFASNTTSSHAFMFGIQDGYLYINDDLDECYTPITVNDGQWHMWTYVRRGTTGYIYVDGGQQSTHSADFDLSEEKRWSIGQEWDGSGPSDFLTGTVDDARFYTYPLSEVEIKALYNSRDFDASQN